MSTAKTLQRNITVGGDTYPAGTPESKLPKAAREEIAAGIGDKAYTAEVAPDTSVGAGEYDGRDWTKAKLEAEVESRNEGREEQDQIVVPDPGNKPELVQALEEDDQNNPA
jgi:hypothetical protein